MEKELLMQEKTKLLSLTLAELKEYAKGKVDKYYSYKKEELVDKIIAYEISMVTKSLKPHIFEADETRKVYPPQKNPNIKSLEYPFSFIQGIGPYEDEGYDINDMIIPMPGEPEEELGNFPNNIQKYLWVYEGANDEEPWLALVQLNNGNYAFYRGECDYTGFECQSLMELYVSKSLETLVRMAMTNEDYRKYEDSY